MITRIRKPLLLILAATSFFATSYKSIAQSSNVITVKANEIKAEIQPTMWGIFFEDINFGADGGLYSELVKNRSFEFFTPLMGWKVLNRQRDSAKIIFVNVGSKSPYNTRYAHVTVDDNPARKLVGLSNEGYRGMGVKKDVQYNFSVFARNGGEGNVSLQIELVSAKGATIGTATLGGFTDKWEKHSVSFTSSATDERAQLNVMFKGKGKVDVDMISLFPQDTWKNRQNGLRSDLVQKLADMKPGFLRFPGGCIVEGRELETRFQWKKTVGPVENRTPVVNRWNTEFKHRLTTDYFQTFGLGFFEYFQLAEDIGAEPLPILNCGMACQFNSGEVAPLDQLDAYIKDAVDLIEFANGPVDSAWGKVRAEMGHPAPFNLKILGIGNEQWDEQYIERYKEFVKVLKAKYPEIKLVSAAGPFPDGAAFNYAWKELKALNAEIIDEHYYANPAWFLKNAKRYDNYDRKGPKVFAGEYAAQSVAIASPDNQNNWRCALAEAAFMTGLERNADVVHLASYAPLFAHVEGWQWTPDLIWFDNLRSYGTPNYYVQKMYGTNKGTSVVPITMNKEVMAGTDSLYASACIDKTTNELILKLVNTSGKSQSKSVVVDGVKRLDAVGKMTVLQSNDLNKVNSLDEPMAISPKDSQVAVKGKKLNLSLAPYSFNVVRIKM
ncbi:MAG: alpha-L-arabinofuranosidase [Segetibacter sp.]|nr:alpha-L-arabinofuranosidase [Segetibacter sp.]